MPTVGINSLPFVAGIFLLSYILQRKIRNKIFRCILVPILVLTLITLLLLQKILHLRRQNNSPVQTTFRVSQHAKTLGTKFN